MTKTSCIDSTICVLYIYIRGAILPNMRPLRITTYNTHTYIDVIMCVEINDGNIYAVSIEYNSSNVGYPSVGL